MTSQQLAQLSGAVLSVILGYAPVVKDWYDKLSSMNKARVAALLTIAVAVVVFLLACKHVALPFVVTCSQQGLWQLAIVLLGAIEGLGGAYIVLVRPFKPKAVAA